MTFAANKDEKVRRDVAARFAENMRLDLDEQRRRQQRIVELLVEVGPIDLVARASAIYLSMDPNTYRESESDRSPAHIEFLALQALACQVNEPTDCSADRRLQATYEAIGLAREMFEAEANGLVSSQIESAYAKHDSGEEINDIEFRARLASLGIRGTGYWQHVERILLGCFDPISQELRAAIGFDVADVFTVFRSIVEVLDERREPRHVQVAAEVEEYVRQLKRARRGRKTDIAIPDALVALPFEAARYAIYQTVFEKGRRVCAARAALWSIVDGWLGVSGGIPRTPAMSSGR